MDSFSRLVKAVLIGTAASLILGCANQGTIIGLKREIDPETGIGYEIVLKDRDNNGRVDLIQTKLICNGITLNPPIKEKNYLNRTIILDEGMLEGNQEYFRRYHSLPYGKAFKVMTNGNNVYSMCKTK